MQFLSLSQKTHEGERDYWLKTITRPLSVQNITQTASCKLYKTAWSASKLKLVAFAFSRKLPSMLKLSPATNSRKLLNQTQLYETNYYSTIHEILKHSRAANDISVIQCNLSEVKFMSQNKHMKLINHVHSGDNNKLKYIKKQQIKSWHPIYILT
jgi:hypothetical protein